MDSTPPPPPLPACVDSTAGALAVLDQLAADGQGLPGSLLLVLADARGEALLVLGVDEVPADPPQHERVRTLAPFLREIGRRVDDVRGLVLGVCRDGPASIEGGDLAWHDAVAGVAPVAGLIHHGTYALTPGGTLPVVPGQPEGVA